MPAPILATKFYIPPPRPGMVLRPRLVERLSEGLAAGCPPGVVLISAPAGFGKTTLVSEWLVALASGASGGGPGKDVQTAWLSLDEGDNDLNRFLMTLITALQTLPKETAGEEIGAAALAALQSAQPAPAETILAILLNELSTIPGRLVLVLDDYHVIDCAPIDQTLAFLVDHLPPQMHLVIASREDPPLPLARLRARGQLTELRAADLRFTPGEAAEFLNRMMGLNLSDGDIASLESRTEGWIAGLQLAAISMRGHQDAAGFIRAFTGSHRFVLDYLVEEVLRRQPEPIRSFLLQTAILDRLCPPLCNAVTQREDGKAALDFLDRNNLFLIPLDDAASHSGSHWVRYHHLFAEVLQTYLGEEQPDQVSVLHRRASAWFEQNDLPAEAIKHALAAEDFERAADLVERVWLVMDLSYQSAAWLKWVKALPDELIRTRPVLCAGYGWALLNSGDLETSEDRLRDAERWLLPGETPPGRMVVVDEAEFRALPASIASARAYRALALGDIASTKMYARQTLALVREGDPIRRTQATALLGMAEYASGDLVAAEQEFLKFQAMMWHANNIANAISITFILANIMLIQGKLQEAVRAYRQSLQVAVKRGVPMVNGAPAHLGASDLYRGLSEVLCEQGDLEGAVQLLQTARQLGERSALTGWPHRLCVAQARIQESQGDLDGALVSLNEAEQQYVRSPLPDRPIAALKARIWARQGRLSEAMAWVSEQGLSPGDDLSYLREFEHQTLARVLILRDQAARVDSDLHAAIGLPARQLLARQLLARQLLARLLQAAQDGGRTGSVIEILVLQALAFQAQDDLPQALASLERALTLAEPQGYVRTFVDEGSPMRLLLEELAHQRDHPLRGYAARLLAAFPQPAPGSIPTSPSQPLHQGKADPGVEIKTRQATTSLVEPLSERELEVLRLLRSELSGPQIALELVVSLNTLRTHTKNIFTKLGVNNRRAAVRRAQELDLL